MLHLLADEPTIDSGNTTWLLVSTALLIWSSASLRWSTSGAWPDSGWVGLRGSVFISMTLSMAALSMAFWGEQGS